jgi:hypothetical protein
MEQAKTAGLTGSDMYRKYPDLMLRWRCASMLIKLCYSDVILGLYDPEELRDTKAERDVTPPVSTASVIDSVATPLPTPPPAKVHRMTMVDEPAPAAGEDIASAIAAAPDRAALEGLVGRIRARPEPERATLRPAYEARLKAVAK